MRSIKKQQLVEVRSMANPPSVVKMALESICTLLGEKGDTWKGIRSVVMKDNFISTIVNFETENVTLVSLNLTADALSTQFVALLRIVLSLLTEIQQPPYHDQFVCVLFQE